MEPKQAEEESSDQRDVELSSLQAIFPEIQIDNNDPYSMSLEIIVNPARAVNVKFPAAHASVTQAAEAPQGQRIEPIVESHNLSYLPPVHLKVTLPSGYPDEVAPQAAITTSPPWLPLAVTKRLEEDASRLWEDFGHDLIAFSFIDHVQQAADEVFGLVDESGSLEVDSEHKIAILDHDIKARAEAFDRGTFDCGVCLDPKKGRACHHMLDCEHVFCKDCLRDFYNNAITEGDLPSVRCLDPTCAKERIATWKAMGKSTRKPKTFLSPSELLQIPLEREMVQRYVSLKYKTELESDKNTVYCPRSWCNGAARSKKHKKPEGLEFAAVSDDSDAESDGEDAKAMRPYDGSERLAICEDCGFAFCSRCFQSWHGEYVRCTPRRDKEELTAEEKASLEYVKLHTTPCPTCDAPVQKTHGCNHMICYRCQSHFCYLCSSWLDPDNPYQHYNIQPGGRQTTCYMRLWELEAGDGGDVDYGFIGGVIAAPPAEEANDGAHLDDALQEEDPEIENQLPEMIGGEVDEVEVEHARRPEAPERGQDRPQAAVAREGPLVLRIAAEPAAAHRNPPAQPQPPLAGGRRDHQLQNMRGRGRGGRGGQGGRPRQQVVAAAAAAAGGGAADGRRGQRQDGQPNRGQNHAGRRNRPAVDVAEPPALNADQQAWVRQFVRLALVDDEHLVDSDSDEDDEEVIFWRDDHR